LFLDRFGAADFGLFLSALVRLRRYPGLEPNAVALTPATPNRGKRFAGR